MRKTTKEIDRIGRINRISELVNNFENEIKALPLTIKTADVSKIKLNDVVALDETNHTVCAITASYTIGKTLSEITFGVVKNINGTTAYVSFEEIELVRISASTTFLAGVKLELDTSEEKLGTFKAYGSGLITAVVIDNGESTSIYDQLVLVRLSRGVGTVSSGWFTVSDRGTGYFYCSSGVFCHGTSSTETETYACIIPNISTVNGIVYLKVEWLGYYRFSLIFNDGIIQNLPGITYIPLATVELLLGEITSLMQIHFGVAKAPSGLI